MVEWMKRSLYYIWKELLLAFPTKKLLAWDIFEAHMIKPVKKLFKEMRINNRLFPGGCTKYIQAPDAISNKPSKGCITEF